MQDQQFEAHCYASQSSYSERVTVNVNSTGQISFEFQQQWMHCFFTDTTISARLGNTPRFIDLPSGLRLETDDNAAIDALLQHHLPQHKQHRRVSWLHGIERSLRWVMVMLVVVALSGFGLYQYGIPWLAKIGSPIVPDPVRHLASKQTLLQMDELMLQDTHLFSWEQRHYRELVRERLQAWVKKDLHLEFRNSPVMGANAFALPDGTLVFTDQILSQLTDEEFLAIAAHEAGHVIGDHGMRSVISSTSLLVAITLITGDSEAISEILVTAPTLLMQMSYSRDLEAEADDFAMGLMRQADLPLAAFATGLEKIVQDQDITDDDNGWLTYFSTHPEPYERMAKFRNAQ